MSFDVPQPSLPELFRSLNIAPDYKRALVALAEQVEQTAARLEHEAEHQQMLARAAGPPAVPRPRGHRAPREHPHLRLVVPAVAAATALAAAALRACAAWVLKSGARRTAAGVAAALAVGGGAVVAPDLAQTAAPAPAAVRVAPVPGPVAHHGLRRPSPAGQQPVMARRRRRADHDPADAPDPRPTATPMPTPTTSPPPTPTPSPSPSCPHPGHKCGHSVTEGALGGTTWLAWDDMPVMVFRLVP